tara:strand:- start:110 stop:643 length:534 start_codon:yes stop_codon:yes gene_type:complete
MKGIITCFENFDSISDNTSKKVVESLALPNLVLPVSFKRCDESLPGNLDFMIQVGVAASRNRITIERYAHNLAHSPVQADNDGQKPLNDQIVTTAPIALETNFDFELIDSVEGNWDWSLSAGSYVCNALYFKTLHRFPKMKTIFVHIPYHLSQPDQQASLEQSAKLIKELWLKITSN